MNIMLFILPTLQITTKPPSNQHIYRIPETQSTKQNLLMAMLKNESSCPEYNAMSFAK
jgi:hypothetical protein